MDDRIRASDADRDRATARPREHFAAGRLAPGELDERLSAALNAKTLGDLRRVMTDLPEPAPIPPPREEHRPRRAAPPWTVRRDGPRVLPLMLLPLLAALLIPGGGWLLFASFQADPDILAHFLPGGDARGRPVPPPEAPLAVRLRPAPDLRK